MFLTDNPLCRIEPEKKTAGMQAKIYPNPYLQNISIEFERYTNIKYSIYIYNSKGQLVLLVSDITINKTVIEKNILNEGLYYFQIRSENKIISQGKFIHDK